MRESLKKKVSRAIKLIQSASKIAKENGCQEIEIAYSGGKDSDVILELAKMADVPFRAIHHCTTIDPSGTIKHAKAAGAEILRPKKTFFQLIVENGYPSRFSRFCCRYLKEYKVLDYVILGIRADESNKRRERYKEPELCRVYNKNEKARHYLPILDWTKVDVLEFIEERNIKLHPLYYDKEGNVDVARRLGCMCCPLQTHKQRIDAFKKHPNMVKLYVRGGGKYLDNHPISKISQIVKDPYEFFCFEVFCDRKKRKFKELFGGDNIFGETIDCKLFLEGFFHIKFDNNKKV